MKATRKLLAGAIATSLVLGAVAPVVNAEVSGSVGVASSYLWRGIDLGVGNGTPAVSGDLNFSGMGFYGGVWASSGDSTAGTEYDLYAGYGGSAGDFSYDFSLWSYQYPTSTERFVAGITLDDGTVFGTIVTEDSSPDVGDLMEGVVSLGYGPVTATYYHGFEDLEDYWYATLGATFGAFTVKYGQHETDMSHLDFSYAYNDNLTFTFSQVLDNVDEAYDDDLNVVVSYSIPIE